jgi:nucleotide-binding universal stress UspA family protein
VTPRVVVGVDGSGASLEALHYAVQQAALLHGTVTVVAAWQYPMSYGWTAVPPGFDVEADTQAMVEDAVRRTAGDAPGVPIDISVVEGHPAAALVQAAQDADLLVVGSRGHGAFAGMLLGSVSTNCAQHAPCPVVIVRHQE